MNRVRAWECTEHRHLSTLMPCPTCTVPLKIIDKGMIMHYSGEGILPAFHLEGKKGKIISVAIPLEVFKRYDVGDYYSIPSASSHPYGVIDY